MDQAVADLQQVGFEVFRMPEKYRGAHPRDVLLEAVVAGTDKDAVEGEVNAIVDKFGGLCVECGQIEPGYTPFPDLFNEHMQRFFKPDDFCLHCQRPANQYYPVGPIVITTGNVSVIGLRRRLVVISSLIETDPSPWNLREK